MSQAEDSSIGSDVLDGSRITDYDDSIYLGFVKGQDDVLGFIAYGIYKQHKNQYENVFKEKYSRQMNSVEMDMYCEISIHFSEFFRAEADKLLASKELTNESVPERKDDVKKEKNNLMPDEPFAKVALCALGTAVLGSIIWVTVAIPVLTGGWRGQRDRVAINYFSPTSPFFSKLQEKSVTLEDILGLRGKEDLPIMTQKKRFDLLKKSLMMSGDLENKAN